MKKLSISEGSFISTPVIPRSSNRTEIISILSEVVLMVALVHSKGIMPFCAGDRLAIFIINDALVNSNCLNINYCEDGEQPRLS